MGKLDEAEKGARGLLKKAPRDMGLFLLLGRVLVARGNRGEAMQVLEGGLTTCCSSPGKCGNQPFNVGAGRLLARLYLEERIEPKRSKELLQELEKNVRDPGWDDRYLAALVARNADKPDAYQMARTLWGELKPGDGRRKVVAEAFAF